MHQMTEPRGVRVLLADDHTLFRRGLAKLLSDEPWITIVGEAADGQECVRLAEELVPDVAIVDLKLPKLSGIEVAREILARVPKTKVLIVTGVDADNQVGDALAVGVSGYLLKESEPEAVCAAVTAVVNDLFAITNTVARRVFGAMVSQSVRRDSFDGVSARELEILKLMASGLANKQVARQLGLSEKTVRNHIANIYEKLGIHDRSQALLYAVRKGLVDPTQIPPEPEQTRPGPQRLSPPTTRVG
jgi:DNA-binding NarL/FixJ family response regulator